MSQALYYLCPSHTQLSHGVSFVPLDLEDEPMVDLPLLGAISAGHPSDAIEDRETLRLPSHLTRRVSYALRVRGHSMTDDQIQDGDIILIEQRKSAQNGETVVALLQGGRATLKRFFVEADGIRLQPANPEMEPLYLRADAVEVLGVVTGVIRMTA